MLYEGLCIVCHRGHLGTTVLLDTGATSNNVSPRVLQQVSISYHSSTNSLKSADDSEAPILSKVRLRLKIQNFTATIQQHVGCCVTDLAESFDVV